MQEIKMICDICKKEIYCCNTYFKLSLEDINKGKKQSTQYNNVNNIPDFILEDVCYKCREKIYWLIMDNLLK